MSLYYAIFNFDVDGINVSFPDIDGAFTCGEDMHEALYMAKDLLEGLLVDMEDEGESFPVASTPQDIDVPQGDLLIPIEANVQLARERFNNTLIKKTLSIPNYLNIWAEKENINFSATLTEALKNKLGV
ncbi:type II toxin-antitoxin system HicB family antitoxin [Allofustis seminis]|uniref:type II toxin-antitoxin system HicB family antitoxin n=1 Tax=Allofustis seminis TaxID=166939 RepID=UPI000382A1EF|nr:type II toxin-antitoxin system HicB family antitoxin [Allofustis seminis]